MCGIYGLFLNRPLTDEDIEQGRQGRNRLEHRGPDDRGEWLDRDAGVYLGHTRLAILDPSEASAQPMRRGDSVIVYNGEIYNFESVRDDLGGARIDFGTTGDTEVLLEGWRHRGPDLLDDLDGMWAFAIWDGDVGHVSVGPFGEKPMFLAELDDGVAVSSELAPLVAFTGRAPEMTGSRVTETVALGHVPAPGTAFPGIRRLRPRTYLRIEDGGVADLRRYWSVPSSTRRPKAGVDRPSESDIDRVQAALVDSLEGRLQADVPRCLFLSGGLDSSLVAAMVAEELDADLECITIRFPVEEGVDETPHAEAVADHLDLDHRVVDVDAEAVHGPDRFLELLGQPLDDVPVLATNRMARAARDLGYKVALTGMGGDEVFFGYNKHHFLHEYRGLYHLPEPVRQALGGLARAVGLDGSTLEHFADLIGVPDREVYLARKNYPAIGWLRELPGFDDWARERFGDLERPFYAWVRDYELSTTMANSQLPSLDVASMREGLELRTPFLSRWVVDAVAEIPPRALIAPEHKHVVKRLLRRYLPEKLVRDDVQGFWYPIDPILEDQERPDVPGLDDQLVREVWSRRSESRTWKRLALRLTLIDRLMDRHGR